MTLTKSRRASAKANALPPLPDLSGRWDEAALDALSEEMLADLEGVAARSKPVAGVTGLQVVAVAAWLVSHKQRSEEWLRMAFARIDELERQLKQVKAAPVLTYKGPWRQGDETLPGQFVTYQGSVWHCNKKTMSRPSDDPAAYTLAVKSGKDARETRP